MGSKKVQQADDTLMEGLSGFMTDGSEAPESPGLLDQMLTDVGGSDGTDDAELGVNELGVLEDEFADVVVLRRRKAELKERLSVVQGELEAQESRMKEALKLQGTTAFKSATGDGTSCTFSERYDTKVTDPQALIDWFMEHHPEMLSVNSQARTSFIKKNYADKGIDEDDDSFPDGIEVTSKEILTVRGVKSDTKKKKGS